MNYDISGEPEKTQSLRESKTILTPYNRMRKIRRKFINSLAEREIVQGRRVYLMVAEKEELDIYMANKTFGGEYIWLERIARKLGSNISFIWPRNNASPVVPFSGLKSKLIISLCKIIPKGRGLFMNILISYCSFQSKRKSFVSTPYYPIPINTTIAYIQTPSRRLTVSEEYRNEDGFLNKVFWKIFKIAYRHSYCASLTNAKFVFVNSKNISSRISQLCKLEGPIEVLYPTQDTREFSCGKQGEYFFSPSRFTPQKNQIFLIEAFAEFCDKFKNDTDSESDLKLILAGSDPISSVDAKKYFEVLKDYVSGLRNEIKNKIEFVLDKSRKEILEYYSNSFSVLYAGRNEDFGFVPVEGMLSSKPVIALNEGGMRETVNDGINGYLVRTPSEMAEKMLILAKDRNLAKSMGESGRKLALRFDDDIFISKIKTILEN